MIRDFAGKASITSIPIPNPGTRLDSLLKRPRLTRLIGFCFLGPLLLLTVGCGPKSQLRDDPFSSGARTNASNQSRWHWPWTREPSAAKKKDRRDDSKDLSRDERDTAREVATSPLTPGERSSGGDRGPRGDVDPFKDSNPTPPTEAAFASSNDREGSGSGKSSRSDDSSNNANRSIPSPRALDYQNLRSRLDRAGARNKLLETDPATGEYLFRCEIPHPSDPHLVRVFEAKDPDELKAMASVVDAIDDWSKSPKR